MESPSNKSQYIESPLSNKTLNTSLSLTHSIKEDFILTYSYGIDVKKKILNEIRLIYQTENPLQQQLIRFLRITDKII